MTDNTADSSIFEADAFDAFRPILGQIAHDYNNLLTPLLAYPGLLKTYLENAPQSHDLLDAIEKASQDMIHINEQLMLMSSRGTPEQLDTPVSALIDEVVSKLGNEIDISDKTIEVEIGERLPTVHLSAPHFSKALHNLIVNACESKPGDVSIKVSAQSASISPDLRAKLGAPYAGEYLQVAVTDDGPGFTPDILPKACVPFFTTKKENRRRGSGLGLSIAHIVCKDHGGFLSIQNNETTGKGASCSLYIPAVRMQQSDPTDQSDAEDAHGLVPRDKNRILLVDDEDTIRQLFHMIISDALPDCQIDTARNGQVALDLFSKHHHGCLILDLFMPVMDGQSAFQEINKMTAERGWEPPSVVFCTGYAPPDLVSKVVANNSLHCLLSKPVRGEVLVEAIKNRIS